STNHPFTVCSVKLSLARCYFAGMSGSPSSMSAGYADHINGHGLIWPLIATIVFLRQYKRLGHLKESIASMAHATVKQASGLCKQLFKSKLKQSPDIVQTTSKRFRLRLMSDSVLCVQRNQIGRAHV